MDHFLSVNVQIVCKNGCDNFPPVRIPLCGVNLQLFHQVMESVSQSLNLGVGFGGGGDPMAYFDQTQCGRSDRYCARGLPSPHETLYISAVSLGARPASGCTSPG